MPQRILVVGGGVAGATSALTAREYNDKADVTILSNENHLPYRRAAIIDIISGRISRPENIYMSPEAFYVKNRIGVELNTEVSEIDTNKNVVKSKNKLTGKEKIREYDTLIIAVGGKPLVQKIPGTNKVGVFSPATLNDAFNIANYVEKGKRAIIEGAGFIGLKIAEALLERGVDVTMVVRSRILRTLLEEDFSSLIHKKIEKLGGKNYHWSSY